MKVFTAVMLAGFAGLAQANEIPLSEQAFIDRIKTTGKAEIVAQLGEPARKYDVKDDETGEVMGSIWHYHYLNTAESGEYYKTTELDFVGDQVVTVVFSTTEDGNDAPTAMEPEAIQEQGQF
jgi:hypothetical protein